MAKQATINLFANTKPLEKEVKSASKIVQGLGKAFDQNKIKVFNNELESLISEINYEIAA